MNTAKASGTDRAMLRRTLVGGFVGTSIEWYDFFLFGSAAALIFNRVFFPSFDPLTGTLLSFATYAVAFVARPLGGILFGYFGDRRGRKSTLVATLVVMGTSTVLMGLLPGYETIGIAAPLLLVVLRFTQGLGLGGEWGGAVSMVVEHGDAADGAARRGFYASFPQIGVPMGNLLAVGALALTAATTSEAAFSSWGWRIPFLLSAVLVVVGLWIRRMLSESPAFEQMSQQEPDRQPLREIVRDYKRPLLITIGLRIASDVSYYTFALFSITYATQKLGLGSSIVLNGVVVASIVQLVAIPYFAALSDRVGRRPVYLVGAIGVGAWSFAFFPLFDSRSPVAATIAITVGLLFQAVMYGPMAAFIAEMFPTRVRYSGSSAGYQLAGVIGGSLAPLIGVALLARYGHSLPVSLYTLLASAVTVVAVVLSRETAEARRTATRSATASGPRA